MKNKQTNKPEIEINDTDQWSVSALLLQFVLGGYFSQKSDVLLCERTTNSSVRNNKKEMSCVCVRALNCTSENCACMCSGTRGCDALLLLWANHKKCMFLLLQQTATASDSWSSIIMIKGKKGGDINMNLCPCSAVLNIICQQTPECLHLQANAGITAVWMNVWTSYDGVLNAWPHNFGEITPMGQLWPTMWCWRTQNSLTN